VGGYEDGCTDEKEQRMSEPSSGVPSEIADADVQAPEAQAEEPEQVTLDVDEEKLEAWDEVKSDYQVEPDGRPTPNSMATTDLAAGDETDGPLGAAEPDSRDEEADGTAPG
jgi:hypothetical protein